MGLSHLPSGRFAAYGAWLAVHVIADNLAGCTARLGPRSGPGIAASTAPPERDRSLLICLVHGGVVTAELAALLVGLMPSMGAVGSF